MIKKLPRVFLGALVGLLATCAMAADKPNFVFIMADDLGWADVGFNGNKFYETPNLDRICKTGMKFNRSYSGGPNCLPTRACLISGMYTPRTQIWTPGGKSKGNPNLMKLKVPARGRDWNTFPSKLNLEPSVISIAEVLKTAGYKTARFGKWHVGPDTQGFDISDANGKGSGPGGNFYGNIDVHEWLTDASVKFIEDSKDRQFFLYLCHWDVHTPIRARKDVVSKYDEKLKNGKWERQWNTTYAGMIHAVDLSVKRVHAKLVELGLDKNTVFVFTSDNGGHAGATTNKPLRGAKGAFYEGGVRVPTFISWPATIKADTECDTPITSVDFMPTFAALAKAKLPTKQPVDGTSIVPLMEGKQLAKRSIFWHYPLYLQGSGEGKVVPIAGTDNFYWRAVPSTMIMKGDWKLMHFYEDASYKLYNLKDDIGETKDLSKTNPEKAKELNDELLKWVKDTKAIVPTEQNDSFNAKAPAGGKKRKKKK